MAFTPDNQYKNPSKASTQPDSGGFDLGKTLSSIGGAAKSVGDVLLPRATNFITKDYPQYLSQEVDKLKQGQMFQNPIEANQQASKIAAPVAGELGMFAIPGAGEEAEGANLLQKAGTAAARFAPAGALYGATDPNAKNVGDRVKNALGGAATSTALGPLIEGILGKIGIGAGKMAINPEVQGGTFGWAGEQANAVKEALNKTTAVTPEELSSQMGKRVADISNHITDSLDKNKNSYSFLKDIEPKLEQYIKDHVDGVNLETPVSRASMKTGTVTSNDAAYLQKFKDIIRNSGESTAPNEANHDLGGLFNARKKIDDALAESKTWENIGKGVVPKMEQRIGIATRQFLKDFVGGEAENSGIPGISDLTEIEHKLYQAGEGLKNGAGRGMKARSPRGLLFKSMIDPALLTTARAGTSPIVQNEALMKILNTLGIK